MTATSVIDDRTATAIREAITASRSGRVPEAIKIAEQALADGGDPTPLNAMLGSIHCQSGNLDAGIRHLRLAHQTRPDDAVIVSNLATALAQQGQYAAALDVVTESAAKADPTMRLLRIRAFLAQEAKNFEVSIPAYEAIVSKSPEDWESWNNLGNARRLSGDYEGSVGALEQALALNPSSPPIRLNHAMALARAGRVDEAEQHLRRMATDYPQDTKPLFELHAIMRELGRGEAALEAIEEAVRRRPKDKELLLVLGGQRLNQHRLDAAEDAYRRILEFEPSHDLANLGLAVVFELTNRTDELTRLVDEAQGRGASDNAVNFIRAMVHRRERRFAEGLEALAKVPEDLENARRCELLGQLQEGAGNNDEAFAAFTRMNQFQEADLTRPAEGAAAFRESLRMQLKTVDAAWVKGWRHEAERDERPSPVFLVGFPRSGTTLLDTMLMGHPDVEVLEEEPTLLEAAKRLQPFEHLPTASDDQIRAARDEYFRVAALQAPLAPGKLLVDKNPLSMTMVPIIRRLFPDARIILALRHPCDAVFSCFAANFDINDGMSNFHRLDTAAEFYDLSFTCFEKVRDLFELPVHTVVYEKVLENQERELRGLLGFLGLAWNDAVLDHQVTAKNRGRIKTASYAQVGQPIYSQSAGRWTNFRKHLEPVLPVLEPWVRKFGYSL
jgi:tetratricopeptide (TPR) repeat protein